MFFFGKKNNKIRDKLSYTEQISLIENKLLHKENIIKELLFKLKLENKNNILNTITKQHDLINKLITTNNFLLEKIDEYKCSICFENDKNIALNCGHTFCDKCINNYHKKYNYDCPSCHKRVSTKLKLFL
jgi:hypothetical protein